MMARTHSSYAKTSLPCDLLVLCYLRQALKMASSSDVGEVISQVSSSQRSADRMSLRSAGWTMQYMAAMKALMLSTMPLCWIVAMVASRMSDSLVLLETTTWLRTSDWSLVSGWGLRMDSVSCGAIWWRVWTRSCPLAPLTRVLVS